MFSNSIRNRWHFVVSAFGRENIARMCVARFTTTAKSRTVLSVFSHDTIQFLVKYLEDSIFRLCILCRPSCFVSLHSPLFTTPYVRTGSLGGVQTISFSKTYVYSKSAFIMWSNVVNSQETSTPPICSMSGSRWFRYLDMRTHPLFQTCYLPRWWQRALRSCLLFVRTSFHP